MEVVSILAFILGIIGAFKLLHMGMDLLSEYFSISGTLLPYVSFILIFLIIIIGVNFLGRALKKIIDLTLLGGVDNIAGAMISVLKWGFGISILLWLSASFGLDMPEEWQTGSLLYPYVFDFAPLVVGKFSFFMPFAHDLFDTIKDFLEGDSFS